SNTSGAIGIGASSSDYASITPGSPATVSYSSTNTSSSQPAAGTLYTFYNCNVPITIAGTIAQGGTVAMANGDSLLTGKTSIFGVPASYTPFTISSPTGACSNPYTYSITGANAADYQIVPGSGSIPGGATATPTLTFTPRGTGLR